ncbi:enoyl-CoA hydratase-related protein [Sandarakinorhabdus sp. AAP62]|uniref:enoyl-CoA hydratase/isomerase family protein n=1 Tax=Sandarakinorhabdus sp. AAP62 TaxID=1248916 RepID=UPI000319E14C|nr:enoyl-CoA hydratase-related protein [Sandarakinorhabdus sp. AAP62]
MTLRLEHDGPITRLLIDRADKRNALTLAMWEMVPGLLAQAAQRPELRLLVVQAAQPGGAFCAGADIAELLANSHDRDWLAANQAAINRAQHELTRFALPTIAWVEGDAVGGGCGLALACDIRIATHSARFGITPGKLGIVYPLHDVKLLVDLIGPGQAKRLLFSAALIDADEAYRIGLVELLAGGPSCIKDAIVAASRHSTRAAKDFVRRVLDGQSADDGETLAVFAAAFSGADFAEGAAAFMERRPPQFIA